MKTKIVSLFIFNLLFLAITSYAQSKQVDVVTIDGIINPVVAEFLTKAIKRSTEQEAECLIIQMDTPGGLDLSMRSIIKEMMSSDIPIIVYVSPAGARAASAGAIITIAADIAVMSPGTNIGAAHPVALGGGEMGDEMAAKVENDVRESVSIGAQEALEKNVIDIIASDLSDLLTQIDGREIKTATGNKVLATKGSTIQYIEMGLREKVLDTLSNPNISYILMMVGLLGLYFELSNPGAIFPGVIGGICLILAFFAFQTLPVNYAGILLIILSLVLFILEIKVTSFGMLTVGGIIALTLGSLMLFDSSIPFARVSLDVIIPVVVITSSCCVLIVSLAIKAHRRKPTTGREGLLNAQGITRSTLDPEGKVFIHGEYWDAVSSEMIPEGTRVEVLEVKDNIIKVKKA
jgi:membrane-bound serine protease (ClpP class)